MGIACSTAEVCCSPFCLSVCGTYVLLASVLWLHTYSWLHMHVRKWPWHIDITKLNAQNPIAVSSRPNVFRFLYWPNFPATQDGCSSLSVSQIPSPVLCLFLSINYRVHNLSSSISLLVQETGSLGPRSAGGRR